MTLKTLFSVALAMVAVPAIAEDWHFVSSSTTTVHYIDADSIEQSSTIRDFTLFLGYRDPIVHESKKEIFYIVVGMKIDCAGPTQANVTGSAYGLDRSLIGQEQLALEYRPVLDGSAASHYVDFVCPVIRGTYDKVSDPFLASDQKFGRSN